MSVAIIGGGIGGLTTALALKKANIPFKLYEAAPEIKAVGAGIIMANNALQVLCRLGVHQEIYKKGCRVDVITIAKSDFSALSKVNLSGFEKKYGLQNHAIHRADLHEILADAVGHGNMEMNRRLDGIQKSDGGYTLSFEDGSVVLADYVIGADGIKSQVRQQLFSGNEYRDARQICWRGVLDFRLPSKYKYEVVEAWGKGKRFGFAQISGHSVYWYLLINTELEIAAADIALYAEDFDPLAKEMIKQTQKASIIRTPLYDLKPIKEWSKENVCLVGDAAHATTPNLGQGACQAIEDAYVLGELAGKYPLQEAFERYPEIRRKKAHYVVNTSWTFGKIAHWKNPVGVALRDFAMKRLTPESVNLRQMDKLFRLDQI